MLVIALGSLAACQPPALKRAPFAFMESGATGLVFKQPLGNKHKLEGAFDVGPVTDPGGGPPNFFFIEDAGIIEGKYEIGLAVRQVLSSHTTVEVGAGYRIYDINGLSPTPDPNIRFLIETVESFAFHASLRHYLDGPNWLSPRWRWFAEIGIAAIPGIDVDSKVEFLTSSQPISSSGDPYEILTLTGGAAYALTDCSLLEFGVTWEEPLSDIKVDLSTSLDFAGTPITIPLDATMKPLGGIVFLSLTWFPFH